MAADQEATPRPPSLYRKVAEDIKAAIAAGEVAAGTRLPSENELAERYSVSRGTIRQAFAALRADGIIASRRGARRVVLGGPRVQSFGELLSFSRWARATGVLVAGLDMERDSITERLEELGIVFADAEHVIDAVAASAQDARLLGVSPRVPMLRERRLTTDLAGMPVEWSDDRYLGSGSKCANSGGVTAGSLAWSSQRRTATASRAYGSASNAATCAVVIGPPATAAPAARACLARKMFPPKPRSR